VKRRFTKQRIIGFLGEADCGVNVKDLCREHRFSKASRDLFRSKYRRMDTSDARGLSEQRRFGHLRSQITPLPDQVGAAFIVRGRLVGAELFDSPRTFAQLLPKLVRSYGLDALDHSLPRDSAPGGGRRRVPGVPRAAAGRRHPAPPGGRPRRRLGGPVVKRRDFGRPPGANRGQTPHPRRFSIPREAARKQIGLGLS
jgi:hypothetical protein